MKGSNADTFRASQVKEEVENNEEFFEKYVAPKQAAVTTEGSAPAAQTVA